LRAAGAVVAAPPRSGHRPHRLLDQLRPMTFGASRLAALPFVARTTAVAVAINLFAGCDVHLGPGYPNRIVSPDVIGPVASITSLGDGGADVRLLSGEEVRIAAGERSLGGLGDLLLAGRDPEPWHLAGHESQEPDCYWVSASRAYAEPDVVVLTFEAWPGTGVGLQKAAGFDDTNLTTRDADGRRVFSATGSVTFCVDEEGRISGLGTG
jgi:hypothetical protein